MKQSVVAVALGGALVAGLTWLPAPKAHAWDPCVPLDGEPLVVSKKENPGVGTKLQFTKTYTYVDGMVNWTIDQSGGIKDNTGLGFGATLNQVYIPELSSSGSVPGNPGEWVNIDTWHYHTRVLICSE
ncbi:MAG: hypothetical protein P4L86_21175 [Mycobacterium sp.]|nr:hypothetical protein [Mycobacterium sp.]